MLNKRVENQFTEESGLPQLADHGEMINKPGRRVNGYTEYEYLESFFGKDMARRVTTEGINDPIQKIEKSLREKYPINMFLQGDNLKVEEDAFKASNLTFDYKKFPKLLPKDDELAAFLDGLEKHDVDGLERAGTAD